MPDPVGSDCRYYQRAILMPEERLVLLQWVGAIAILLAGFIEVLYDYTKTARVAN